MSKQEVAVVAMGKLVSSLTMVTEEPYSKYPGLFEGLVKVSLPVYFLHSIFCFFCSIFTSFYSIFFLFPFRGVIFLFLLLLFLCLLFFLFLTGKLSECYFLYVMMTLIFFFHPRFFSLLLK